MVVAVTVGAVCMFGWLVVAPRFVGCVSTGAWATRRHAPFRRVIELAVSRSVLVTVSFPERACHPLTV